MRIAITGADGFIGTRLIAAAVAADHEVLALSRRATPAVAGTSRRRFDLEDPTSFDDALDGAEVLIHAAAHVPTAYDDPNEARRCLEVNALGTLALLQACARSGVRRVISMSGNIYRGGVELVSESAPVEPSGRATFYLASKACADLFSRHAARTLPLDIVILRPSSVYGPGLTRGMLVTFATRLRDGKPVQIANGGRYQTDLVHVDDVATAALAATATDVDGTYNLGTGVLTSALEIARHLTHLLGAPLSLLEVAPADGRRLDSFAPLDSTRARCDLGWQPRSLEHGLRDYVSSLRAART